MGLSFSLLALRGVGAEEGSSTIPPARLIHFLNLNTFNSSLHPCLFWLSGTVGNDTQVTLSRAGERETLTFSHSHSFVSLYASQRHPSATLSPRRPSPPPPPLTSTGTDRAVLPVAPSVPGAGRSAEADTSVCGHTAAGGQCGRPARPNRPVHPARAGRDAH